VLLGVAVRWPVAVLARWCAIGDAIRHGDTPAEATERFVRYYREFRTMLFITVVVWIVALVGYLL
jgi:hypothetical protein